MKKILIGLGLMLAVTSVHAKKPIQPDDSFPYSFMAAVDATDSTVAVITNGYFLTKIPGHSVMFRLAPDLNAARDGYAQYALENLYYELSDCVGEPYAILDADDTDYALLSIGIDGSGYSYPDPDGVPQTLIVRSYQTKYGACSPSGGTAGSTKRGLVAPIPVDLGIVPPIRKDLR